MKYVLVTGGAGFIGSYICKLFFDKGFIPVALAAVTAESAILFVPILLSAMFTPCYLHP